MTMRRLTRLGLVVVLLVGCVGCDQASKHLVRSHIALGHSQSFLGDTLRLTRAENPGVFLSAGADLPRSARVVAFQGVVGLIVLGLALAATFARNLERKGVVALTLLAASGLGNLLDRFAYEGAVTDFLNLGIGPIRTGIFNVADVVGVIGIIVLLLSKGDVASPNKPLQRSGSN
jgi:signal peptidase II